ncbi:MAG: hypothetical protein KAR47_12675 [Planctomycetes bacterium]|nr:hypothetical protein [Planctomycetota bacterium]
MAFTPAYDSFGRAGFYVIEQDAVEKVNFAYSYDNNGNIVSKIFNHRTSDPANIYSYDDLDRVVRSDYHNSDNEQFTYDDLGNRLTLNNRADDDVVYTHNNVNEYTGIGGATPLYDAAGNLTRDAAGYTYHYDYENRITKVRKTNDTVDVAIYTYDALGRRIAAQDSVGSATTHYYYDDGQRVLLETDGSDTNQRYFVFGNYIDEVLVMTDNLSGTTEDHYYGHDHLFSPVILFDVSGTVLERYEYDAYGKCAVLDADLTADADGLSDHANPYLFTGRRLDTLDAGALENYYYRARYHDPDTGRFMQRDPLGKIGAVGEMSRIQKDITIRMASALYPAKMKLATMREKAQATADKLLALQIIGYYDSSNLYEYVKGDVIEGLDPYGTATGCGIRQYINDPFPWYPAIQHTGLIVDGADIDYGPPIDYSDIPFGSSPWGGSDIGGDIFNLGESQYGKLRAGSAPPERRCCRNATCSDIKECIREVSDNWDGLVYIPFLWDCVSFVEEVKSKCCLL